MKKNVQKKPGLHPRNPHSGRYQFDQLCIALPRLKEFLIASPHGDSTIDFSRKDAVMCLNMALLAHYYKVYKWQIPDGYLCPPIPGRADYIHYLADLLAQDNNGALLQGRQVRVLDIGVGANCIYPIIGSQSYGWEFVGADIDPISVKVATAIVEENPNLQEYITVTKQQSAENFFTGIVKKDQRFTLTLCNPPFHASQAEAEAGTQRKRKNLARNKRQKQAHLASSIETCPVALSKDKRNFGGQKNELWCRGGERAFLTGMIQESKEFATQICWFSSLVSKAENVMPLKKLLVQMGAADIKVVSMSQGQKISRFLAWTYLSAQQRKQW